MGVCKHEGTMYQTTVTACDACGMWRFATPQEEETKLLLQGELALAKRLRDWYKENTTAAQQQKLTQALDELAAFSMRDD